MSVFLKASAIIIISLLLCLVLSKQSTAFTAVIAVFVCCVIFRSAVDYLNPLFELVRKLSNLSGIDSEIYSVLLKSVGVSFVSEIVSLICTDAGYGALGKTLQILSNIAILWLSIPLLNGFIDIIEKILVRG